MGIGVELLILGLLCMLDSGGCDCPNGYSSERSSVCTDIDECLQTSENCGNNSMCYNTEGSYYCQCSSGYTHTKAMENFTVVDGQCQDVNECHMRNICGKNAFCANQIGSYTCTCSPGYVQEGNIPGDCRDRNECLDDKICGEKGQCQNQEGSYRCDCPQGYTNYGNGEMPCSELHCADFPSESGSTQLDNILSMMRNSCLVLTQPISPGDKKTDGEVLLKELFSATEVILSPGHLVSHEDVSMLLGAGENSIRLLGPQLKNNQTEINTNETVIAVRKGKSQPSGPLHLTNDDATLDTDWETAAGTGPYPGFALAALLSYKNLTSSVNASFEELKGQDRDGVEPSFQVFSRVVSVVVSNPSTQHLKNSVNITLRHLEDKEVSPEVNYICAYWSVRHAWSTDGCYPQHSNTSHTVCTCEHLSSFAVLMALYPMKHPFGLQVVSKIGLIISIVCLILSILTFKFCRSIQGTRTTIHLHLCVCLLLADVIFLAGISQTKPVGGCRFVAGLLHYFFLGVFTWMLLEGVQLYRMVVLVFNATIRPLYLFAIGYGTPLVIVAISAMIRPQGYGTDQHCWLSLEDGLIWSFYVPVCFIILVNVFFFTITVLKLAQKFSSLNPDLTKLQKMKAFTVTAIAQMCILGLMWVFGAFLFEESATAAVAAYIFTILNSLQGALLFFMHCLLSKQVREEYAYFFSCICPQQRQKLSEFSSSSNPLSSRSQGSRGGHQTGESQI